MVKTPTRGTGVPKKGKTFPGSFSTADESVKSLYAYVTVGVLLGSLLRWILYGDLPFFLSSDFWR